MTSNHVFLKRATSPKHTERQDVNDKYWDDVLKKLKRMSVPEVRKFCERIPSTSRLKNGVLVRNLCFDYLHTREKPKPAEASPTQPEGGPTENPPVPSADPPQSTPLDTKPYEPTGGSSPDPATSSAVETGGLSPDNNSESTSRSAPNEEPRPTSDKPEPSDSSTVSRGGPDSDPTQSRDINAPSPATTSTPSGAIANASDLGLESWIPATITDPSGQVFTTSIRVPGSASGGSGVTSAGTSNSSDNTGAIVGGVLGALALIALLVLGLIFVRRRARRARVAPSTAFMQQYGNPAAFTHYSNASDPLYSEDIPPYTPGPFEFPVREKP